MRRCADLQPVRACRGFTLVEAIATIVVIATLGSISSTIIYSGVVAYRDAAAQGHLHGEVSTAMELLTRKLREIPAVPGVQPPAPEITEVTPTSIAWGPAGASRLQFNGGQLELVEGTATIVLLTEVQSFSVACFSAANAPLPPSLSGAAAREVQRIEISLSATRQGVVETLRTRTFLRCLLSGAAP